MAHLDNVYTEDVIPLCQYVRVDGILEGFEFRRCRIEGPAILVLQSSNLINNELRGEEEALLWEIPPTRQRVAGAIIARNCTFEGCTFENVGFAGPPDFIQQLRGH